MVFGYAAYTDDIGTLNLAVIPVRRGGLLAGMTVVIRYFK